MTLRKGYKVVIILTICSLIMMRMVDFAVFDANGHNYDHDHNISNHEIHKIEISHELLEEDELQHANDHDMHDMYHAVLSFYIQPAVDSLDLPNFDRELSATKYGRVSRSISFSPPVPPPLA